MANLAADFDVYADEYERALGRGLRFSGESSGYFARGRLTALNLRLQALGARPGVVLDFGCGTGSSMPLLRAILGADQVIGVDVSTRALAIASAANRDPGVRYMLPGGGPDQTVDCVYSNGVFHHIAPAQRSEAVAYVRAALRPGGLFALCENNPWNPGTRLVMRAIPFDRHAAPVPAPAARALLSAGGFEVLHTDFLFVFPRWLRALRGLERRMQRAPIGAQYMVLARRPA